VTGILWFCAVCLAGPAAPAFAGDLQVEVAGGDSLTLRITVQRANPLPEFVEERLERGIPATVGFQVDVWRDRSVWFDARELTQVEEFKLTRDAWTGTYKLIGADGTRSADSLSTIESILAEREFRVPVSPGWCNGSSTRWVVVTAVVIPLTAKDLGEVEDWLVGELGGKSRGILDLPGGLFSIVRDLSGLGDRKSQGESRRFRLKLRSGDRVLVESRNDS
jgi:hypothetical protein